MISCFEPGDNFALFLSLPENGFLKEICFLPFSSQRNPFSQSNRFLLKETRFLSSNGA